ncbi:MAG: hypothetical protein ACM3ZT_08280 [Bacillota bacterium]
MKKIILAVVCGALLGAAAVSFAKVEHPNLRAAIEDIHHAQKSLEMAEKQNEFDLGGHAKKAQELLKQADSEIMQAVQVANEKKK